MSKQQTFADPNEQASQADYTGLFITLAILFLALLLAFAPQITGNRARGEAFDYAAAADLSGYRWTEMARAYERLGLLRGQQPQISLSSRTLEAMTIDGYRWEAMARGYERLGKLNQVQPGAMLSPRTQATMAIDGYRWTEMGKGYERLGLLHNDQ